MFFSIYSYEGMSDLIALLDTLVDNKGRILIPGIYDSVAELTEKEKKLYEPIDFDLVSRTNFYICLILMISVWTYKPIRMWFVYLIG